MISAPFEKNRRTIKRQSLNIEARDIEYSDAARSELLAGGEYLEGRFMAG